MGRASDAFGGQLAKVDVDLVKKARAHFVAITLSVYRDLVTPVFVAGGAYGSPVASGRLVGSYRVSLNNVDTSSEPASEYRYPRPEEHGYSVANLPPRTVRNKSISGVALSLAAFKLGDVIYVSNSVPYIRRIEVGGHSWQAPSGVFAPTVRKAIKQFAGVSVGRL